MPFPILEECTTNTTTGEKCIFPFIYKDKTYQDCTAAGNVRNNLTKWCATKVNNAGVCTRWEYCDGKDCYKGGKEGIHILYA